MSAPKSELAVRAQQRLMSKIEADCPAFAVSSATAFQQVSQVDEAREARRQVPSSANPNSGSGAAHTSPSATADMVYLRRMLDLDWWRRPEAKDVEAFYRRLRAEEGCPPVSDSSA